AAEGLVRALRGALGGLSISYEGFELKYDPRDRDAPPRRLDDELCAVLIELGELCAHSDRSGVILRYDEFHVVEEKKGTTTISACCPPWRPPHSRVRLAAGGAPRRLGCPALAS